MNEVTNLATEQNNSKRCGHCKQSKSVNEFYKNTKTKDGLHYWCKKCFNDYVKNRATRKKGHQVKIDNPVNHLMYKSCSFSKEGNPNKDLLQRTLYLWSGVRGNATIVSGIDVKRHLKDFKNFISFNYTKEFVDIIEIDPSISKKISEQVSEIISMYPNTKISVINSNIINVHKLHRFVDADLTSSIKYCLPIFMVLFLRMNLDPCRKTIHGKPLGNALICTYSKRGNNGSKSDSKFNLKKDIENITNLSWSEIKTGDPIPMLEITRGSYFKRTDYISGKYSCVAFSYRFGKHTPMVSLLIKWK